MPAPAGPADPQPATAGVSHANSRYFHTSLILLSKRLSEHNYKRAPAGFRVSALAINNFGVIVNYNTNSPALKAGRSIQR